MAGISDIISIMKLPAEMQSIGVTDTDKVMLEKLIKKLPDYQEALSTSLDIEDFARANPEAMKHIIGPFSGSIVRISPFVRSLYAKTIDHYFGAPAAQMYAKILELLNPIRQEQTGAQAAYRELAQMIEPQVPSLLEKSPEDFLKVNRNVQWKLLRKINDIYTQMYQISPNGNWEKYLTPVVKEQLEKIKKLNPQQIREYYFQVPVKPEQVNDMLNELINAYHEEQ
jgi:hypothetical protein